MSLVENIHTVIPQRPPFVMIGELIHCDELSSSSTFTIPATNIFIVNQRLREPALVENIAQTAAARAGYLALRESRPVAIGYIGAIQNLEVFTLPAAGDTLHTEITVVNQVFDVTMISGKVSANGKLVASCEMKIFITKQS